MNKKAYYRYADIVMLILAMAAIAVAISVGLYLFYLQNVDIREQESKILSDKLAEALVERGLSNLNEFDILKEAGLNKKVINNGDFYFKIRVLKDKKFVKEFEEGNRLFFISKCAGQESKFIKCDPDVIHSGDYYIEILAASNQDDRR